MAASRGCNASEHSFFNHMHITAFADVSRLVSAVIPDQQSAREFGHRQFFD
jgi:hypothetical protein